jgi:FSR family fosmidomycin resistance protein-like MFS transporter
MRAAHLVDTDTIRKEQPVEESGFQTMRTVVVSCAHTIHDTYAGFIAPLIPSLIERLSLLKVEAGLFLLLYQGASVLQPVIGHVGDKRNLRKLALFAPAITGIFLSLLATAPSFQIALVYTLIAGISSATLHANLPSLVNQLAGRQVGKGMSIWMVGGDLGYMLGPMVVTATIMVFTIQAMPWLMLAGFFISLLLSILLRDLPDHTVSEKTESRIDWKSLGGIMLPLAGIVIMRSFLRTATEMFLPVFLLEMGADPWFTGAALSILYGFGILGTILGGYWIDRLGYKPLMLVSLVVSSIATITLTYTEGFLQILSLSFLGAASMMVLPIGLTIVHTSVSNNRSMANGFFLAMVFAINALAGVITGTMYDQFGGQTTYLVSGVVGLLGLLFIKFLPDKKLVITG